MTLAVDATIRRGSFAMAVSFVVPAGQVLAVLGPNGSGKTTLLRALAGLTPVADGHITLNGQVIDDVAAAHRPCGYVFQDYRLFPHLTVLENVAFGPRARGLGRAAARVQAGYWLDRLGIAALAGRKPAELSGGQAQRVALARALAGEPAMLLLDEPLAALDARTRLEVQGELRQHLTDFEGPCLLVTHDPLEALVLADRLLVLEDGRVVQDGPPALVARRPATEYVARLVGLNLYSGHADGDAVTVTGGGGFTVPDHGACGDVLVAIRPSAITVGSEPPHGSSARNIWPARIVSMTLLSDRIRLDLRGQPDALADVTPAAVTELSFRPGTEVWLSVKATDIEVYQPAERAER